MSICPEATWTGTFFVAGSEKRASHRVLWPLCLLALAGCGSGDFAAVSGHVTFDGSSLTTGTVIFHPEDGGPLTYGTIQADGRYSLKTGDQSGLRPGRYAVTVSASTAPEGPDDDPQLVTPERYAQASTSGLHYAVAPGGGEYDITLVSAERP